MSRRMWLVLILAAISISIALVGRRMTLYAWGAYGHEISARAAVLSLPAQMPAFFRNATEQLAYLNAEPDRWRDERETDLEPALSGANVPEHYINLENVSLDALASENRYAFLEEVGVGQNPGFALYRMLELFQRVRLEFRMWRAETDPQVRSWIEQRIINDAGILGHYVTDAANPLHTTIHFDGWVGDNPEGYASDNGIHRRFESDFVGSQLTLEDLMPLMDEPALVWQDPREVFVEHIEDSYGLVETLYRMDRDVPFDAGTEADSHREFTAQRLAAGALALRDAWWTAWVSSAR